MYICMYMCMHVCGRVGGGKARNVPIKDAKGFEDMVCALKI